ncbi:PAS domain-containing sensor histidine kinase [Kineococcus sp. SYSU DK001]|uniref:PAS domain-containing sensor histidine kinase n=1 Tax=Kineococcus sp. SYSU DK001 TaxID=3383122 RepID=UPI003D7F0CDC
MNGRELVDTELARLVDSLRYCVLVHDAVTKEILWANQAACDLLGFTLEELKPLKANHMSSPAREYRRELGVAWLQEAVDRGVSTTEWCYRSRTGTDVLTEAVAIRVDLDAGAVVLVQFRDIAAEKAVQQDLSRTSSRLETFLRHLGEGIVVVDDDARVVFASQSAARLLGIEDLQGRCFRDHCDARSANELRELLLHTAPGRPLRGARLHWQRPTGEWTWLAGTCQYIDLEGDLQGHLLLLHDITDRVEVEHQHWRDTQYLQHLARYNAMGDMAMAIAHEVSQPITAAGNFVAGVRSRLADLDAPSSDLSFGLEHALRQIDRASRILTALRQYVTRLEQAERVNDLNDVVAEIEYFVTLRASQHDVRVTWDLASCPLPVLCESVLIGQVLTNLAFNAVDELARWGDRERSLTISTRRLQTAVEVVVADNGGGLAHPDPAKIFDGAFTSKAHGNGIGLALAHRIVTRHGGTIRVEADEPHGTVFVVRLPLVDDPDPEWGPLAIADPQTRSA